MKNEKKKNAVRTQHAFWTKLGTKTPSFKYSIDIHTLLEALPWDNVYVCVCVVFGEILIYFCKLLEQNVIKLVHNYSVRIEIF